MASVFAAARRSQLPTRRDWSGVWQGAAVLLPLLLLAGLGWRGIQTSREDALRDARRGSMRSLPLAMSRLGPWWDAVRAGPDLRLYPDPPVPAPPNEGQAIYARAATLAETDPAQAAVELNRLDKDFPDAPAASGVPLRPLAALLRLRLERGPGDALLARADDVMGDALSAHPSILTPALLAAVDTVLHTRGFGSTPTLMYETRWQTDEQARAVWHRHAAEIAMTTASSLWLTDVSGDPWWVLLRDNHGRPGHRFLARADLSARTATGLLPWLQSLCPDYAAPAFLLDGVPLVNASGETLASQDLEDGLSVRIVLTRPALLYARQRQQTLWLAALLASALAASPAGFWAMRRALTRERQLGELKSNFVASVSHELRAPIASVRLMAENLEAGAVPAESRRREYHALIAEECRRLSALIDNVLDFARIEQNRRTYDFVETDVPALVADAVQLMRPRATQRRQEVQVDAQPVDPPPCCDGLAVRQALINLLDNAVKFSPVETTIRVRVGNRNAHTWYIAVRDEGPGIPPAEHAAIFDRFHRLGNELRRETQGAGIGLSIVRHIAQAHGGSIEVESQSGAGATFTLDLPLLPPGIADTH